MDVQLIDNQKLALTYEEVAEATGISVRQLRNQVRRRRLTAVRIGRSVRFLPEDVRAWLHKRRTHAAKT